MTKVSRMEDNEIISGKVYHAKISHFETVKQECMDLTGDQGADLFRAYVRVCTSLISMCA